MQPSLIIATKLWRIKPTHTILFYNNNNSMLKQILSIDIQQHRLLSSTITTTTTTNLTPIKSLSTTNQQTQHQPEKQQQPTSKLTPPRSSPTGLNLPRLVYTKEEINEIEDYAYKIRMEVPDSETRVKLWLKEKLGLQLNPNWAAMAGQRYHNNKKEEELQKKRPEWGTHFEVIHQIDVQSSSAATTITETPSPIGASTFTKQPPASSPPPQKLFAVIPLAGTQFKVTVGDKVIVNHIEADINTLIEITDVYVLGSKTKTLVGRPNIPHVKVTARVEQQVMEEKLLAFYKREKKWSQNVRGSRRHVTVVRIEDIIVDQEKIGL
jgi:large subunit ribosomal protein L21